MDFQRLIIRSVFLSCSLLSVSAHAKSFYLNVKYVYKKPTPLYYHNGEYFNYYHNGKYYNYVVNGTYYRYFHDGEFYNYHFAGEYYKACANETGFWILGQWYSPVITCV